MTNSKTTRKALLSSALALTMCVAMLIATTFAWFTDTASTAVNRIQAGNLDVDIVDDDGNSLDGQTLKWVQAKSDGNTEQVDGTKILWEPGCTYQLQSFKIKNNGNLALKYKVIISGIVGDAKLLEAIDFTVKADGTALVAKDGTSTVSTVANLNNFEGTLAAGAETDKITITGTMKTTAGNEYQDLTIDGISITVVATQDTVEYDSSSNTYDELAQYPVYTVADVQTTKTEDGATKVASAVTIKSEEKTTVGTESVSVATATIPENVVLEDGATQIKLVVEDSQDTPNIEITSNQAKKTLEVKLVGVSESNDVPATVSFYIESGLTGLELYHNTTEMTSVDSENGLTTASDNSYYYDSETGKVTIKSTKYSPFTYVYDAPGTVTVTTPDELETALNDAAIATINIKAEKSWKKLGAPLVTATSGKIVNVLDGTYLKNTTYQKIFVEASENAVVNINGGFFEAAGGQTNLVKAKAGAVVNVSGGEFYTSGYQSVMFYADGGTIVISNCNITKLNGDCFKTENGGKIVITGGKFMSDPSAYVDETTHTVKKTNENAKYDTGTRSFWTVTAR